MPRRPAVDPAALLRELAAEERTQLEADCALAGHGLRDCAFIPTFHGMAWRAALRIVRGLEAKGVPPVAAYRQAGRRLGVSWQTVRTWRCRVPEYAIRARARADSQ